MACSCRMKKDKPTSDYVILPDQPCLFCAQKHLSLAMSLVNELGYIVVNRQRIIGQLEAVQWHTYKQHLAFAQKVRDLRHIIQNRQQGRIADQWQQLCIQIDAMVQEQLKKTT